MQNENKILKFKSMKMKVKLIVNKYIKLKYQVIYSFPTWHTFYINIRKRQNKNKNVELRN